MKETLTKKYIFFLGLALAVFCIGTILLHVFDTNRLASFGPLASLYFNGLKDGFTEASLFLALIFIALVCAEKKILACANTISTYFNSQSNRKRASIVLGVCLFFAFLLHYPNILNGYFLNDDFEVIDVSRTYTLNESLFVPHGDHTIPLFRMEMYIFLKLFAQNPLPYNMAVFFAFALIPFFTYLIFQRLGFGIKSFAIFLVLYASCTGWADILTGYYDISTYLQISLFCTIAIWSYIAWKQSRRNHYVLTYALATTAALFIDLPGVWVYPSLFLLLKSCI